jgi:hypothetical protein
MSMCLVRMSWLSALFMAIVSLCAPIAVASVHTYDVGALAQPPGDDFFSASWLHDASMSPYGADPNPNPDNRAYRTGFISEQVGGKLTGALSGNALTSISGKLSGNLGMLLNSASFNGKAFDLLLGSSIVDPNRTGAGALRFETNGAGTGEFTGGFIDYQLWVDGASILDGTFFFKPQAETGSNALSPNRGDAQAFTLWGYNYMHDSGPATGPAAGAWEPFLAALGYTGDIVTRSEVGQTLGIALFASDPEPPIENSANPEPTTFLVWSGLALIGFGFCRRNR